MKLVQQDSRIVFNFFGLQEQHALTLNRLSEAIFEMKECALCWCAPRSQLPLCRSHDDGTCAAKTSPWQLKAYLAEEAKQVHTNLSMSALEEKKSHKNTFQQL